MPGKILPSFSQADIESHNTAKSCYVTIGSKVYDVTSFIDDHPGGGDLILEYAGQDVGEIMKDAISHDHSEAAYEILDDCHIGFVSESPEQKPVANGQLKQPGMNGSAGSGSNEKVVYATGMSSAEDLSVETDLTEDYRAHKFLDLNRALFPQLWFGGFDKEFYLEQVHRPRHYKGGASAPLFGNFLEPLSKAAWWIVPTIWLPPVAYGSFLGLYNLSSIPVAVGYWLFGLFLWTIIEYGLHRCLFHIDQYVSFHLSWRMNFSPLSFASC
jgi:4-hydroxysphinganine ceramide fatty acyl 2-hydroxylase